MLHIHLFGHLRLSHHGQPLPFTALPKTLPLWSYLLLHRTQPISREHLAYLLWPDYPEKKVRANLRRHLYDLRQMLPPTPDDKPWLLSQKNTIQWNPHSDYWLDVAEFEQLCQTTAQLPQAVALYTHDLLPDLYQDWIVTHRDRLRNLYFASLDQLVHFYQLQGSLTQAIRYAQQILNHDPIREDTARELMTLRYKTGDRAGAMQTYHHFQQALIEDLDASPMPETEALYETIVDNTPLPQTPPPTAAVPHTAVSPCHNIPSPLTTFFGRTTDLITITDQLNASLMSVRLLTLTGPGGSGKTRLAIEVAHHFLDSQPRRFADGIFFVNLSEITTPALVISTIAETLGVTESGAPSLWEQVKTFLQNKQCLLLLDNFEQVITAAPLIVELLETAPDLCILVTSRILLQVYGEHEYPVLPLPVPQPSSLPPLEELLEYAAISLFIARARAYQPAFTLTAANAAHIRQICYRLDGLPLAIELAAARIKLFSPQAMLAQLTDRLNFLASRTRDLPPRQQTLRQTITWSYNLLSETGQRLFTYLGVFSGTFTLTAVQALLTPPLPPTAVDPGPPIPVLDTLLDLVEQSMIQTVESTEPGASPSFRLLLTLREYALEQLTQHNQLHTLQQRHAHYYLALAEEAEPALYGTDQITWLHRLDKDYDNLRAALTWAVNHKKGEFLLRLCNALIRFWRVRGHMTKGRHWLEQALAIAPAAPSPLRGHALRNVGFLAARQSDYDTAQAYYKQSLEVWQTLEDKIETAKLLMAIGHLITSRFEDVAFARPYHEQSLALFRELNDQEGIGTALNQLGVAALYETDYLTARDFFQESLTIRRQLGDTVSISNALNNLGWTEYALGNYEAACALHQENLAIRRQLGFKTRLGQSLNNLSLAWCQLGDLTQAYHCAREGLFMGQEFGLKMSTVESIEALAMIAAVWHQGSQAAHLWGAANVWRDRLGAARDDIQQKDYDDAIQLIQAQIDQDAFTTAVKNGREFTLEEATTYALQLQPFPVC